MSVETCLEIAHKNCPGGVSRLRLGLEAVGQAAEREPDGLAAEDQGCELAATSDANERRRRR